MTTRTKLVKTLVLLAGLLALPASARAGVPIQGGNTDFPDSTLVMPFSAVGRTTFFSISNVGQGGIDALWVFYDESGQQIDQVVRFIYGEGGTDVVDVTSIRDRTIDNEGRFVEGPARSLAGFEGFAVVIGNSEPRLLGNYTMANTSTNSAFGVNATGFGVLGTLRQGGFLLGTTFNPATLQDNLLVILALDVFQDQDQNTIVTSLTNGAAPPVEPLFNVTVRLTGNDPNNETIAETTLAVNGTALFTTLQALFPGAALNGSASIWVNATEGPGLGNGGFDPDDDDGIGIIGYYGQAVGPFGAGQTLRAGTFFE